MIISRTALIMAASTLAAAPMAAQAAPVQRSAEPTVEESELRGNVLWIILAIVLGVGLYLALDDNAKSP